MLYGPRSSNSLYGPTQKATTLTFAWVQLFALFIQMRYKRQCFMVANIVLHYFSAVETPVIQSYNNTLQAAVMRDKSNLINNKAKVLSSRYS